MTQKSTSARREQTTTAAKERWSIAATAKEKEELREVLLELIGRGARDVYQKYWEHTEEGGTPSPSDKALWDKMDNIIWAVNTEHGLEVALGDMRLCPRALVEITITPIRPIDTEYVPDGLWFDQLLPKEDQIGWERDSYEWIPGGFDESADRVAQETSQDGSATINLEHDICEQLDAGILDHIRVSIPEDPSDAWIDTFEIRFVANVIAAYPSRRAVADLLASGWRWGSSRDNQEDDQRFAQAALKAVAATNDNVEEEKNNHA